MLSPRDDLKLLPLPWKQPAVARRQEPVVQKRHDSDIIRSPDNPACRLKHFVHARVPVGIVKTIFSVFLEISPNNLPFRADLRQSGSYNQRADQAVLL